MLSILKLFKILVIGSILIFLFTCRGNSATVNTLFIGVFISWIVIQIKESKSLPALDTLFVMQMLSETTMIVLGVIMLVI